MAKEVFFVFSGRRRVKPSTFAAVRPLKHVSPDKTRSPSVIFHPLPSQCSWAAMVTSAGLTQPEERLFIFLPLCRMNKHLYLLF